MHTNQLIYQTSPYLLQHAHNPVNWYPWGEEALSKAIQEDKPILVSIGYSACHWCHVMEKESFEDDATAALMNKYFINIKIDREERPDLDHIYMDAVQSISGSGGWPLNVFLTPRAKPFFGGTYFPKVQAYNRISWMEVITNIHTAFVSKRIEIEKQADNLTNHLIKANNFGTKQPITPTLFLTETLQSIAHTILENADTLWGGFGNAPKFPQTFSIQFLLRHYHFTKDNQCLQHAELSLQKMIAGGLYDQVAGGFSRYSTDEKWFAPHFEKMLYDNALLLMVLSEAYQITGNKKYAETIHHTFQFLTHQLLNDKGAFYSALDADSEGVEGKYYTWSKQEIDAILQIDAALFCQFFAITEQGNWEHTNILWTPLSTQQFAVKHSISEAELIITLERCKLKLLSARNKRIPPALDDKIILGWNALMITACCKAFAATSQENYKILAENCMQFLETHLTNNKFEWLHTYKNKQAKYYAFLDDYAYVIQAYIELQEITGNANYLLKAKQLVQYVIDNFSDYSSPYFYYTHCHQNDVIIRKKEIYDGAIPSGNAMMALNLQYLAIVFNNNEWKNRAEQMLVCLDSAITKHPTSFGVWASVLQLKLIGINEIVITGQSYTSQLNEVLQLYIPNKVLQCTDIKNDTFPLFQNKLIQNKTAIYLCKEYACHNVFENINQLQQHL